MLVAVRSDRTVRRPFSSIKTAYATQIWEKPNPFVSPRSPCHLRPSHGLRPATGEASAGRRRRRPKPQHHASHLFSLPFLFIFSTYCGRKNVAQLRPLSLRRLCPAAGFRASPAAGDGDEPPRRASPFPFHTSISFLPLSTETSEREGSETPTEPCSAPLCVRYSGASPVPLAGARELPKESAPPSSGSVVVPFAPCGVVFFVPDPRRADAIRDREERRGQCGGAISLPCLGFFWGVGSTFPFSFYRKSSSQDGLIPLIDPLDH